jgi:hypothetical protein
MQKNKRAWFKYELIPVKQTDTLLCVTAHIDEQIEFHYETNGLLRFIHTDSSGKRLIAQRLTTP